MPWTEQDLAAPSDLDRVLHITDMMAVGSFRAPVGHPRFTDSGPIPQPLFVFPRTSVVIRHKGQPPVTADPCTVTFYNRGQRYTREPLDPRGDHCEWFAVRPGVLEELLAGFDPAVEERPGRPFDRTHGRSDSRSYAAQRAIARHLAAADDPDPLAVDEAVLAVLDRVLALTYGHGAAGSDAGTGGHPLVQRVRTYLQDHFRETSTLDEIADAVGSSVFHLCRVFKRETGRTIHAYRQELRLRHGLELIAEPGSNLSAVAHRLGFSSHSHFSAAFKAAFDTTPSRFRRHPTRRRIRELSARLDISA